MKWQDFKAEKRSERLESRADHFLRVRGFKSNGEIDPVRRYREGRPRKEREVRHVVIPGAGDRCPRCGLATEIREHIHGETRHLTKAVYFSRWFYCRNPQCVVTTYMVDRYKVVAPRASTYVSVREQHRRRKAGNSLAPIVTSAIDPGAVDNYMARCEASGKPPWEE